MSSVAVVGAGITGLVAAFELTELGVPVTVYETANRVGGVIQSFHEKGFIVESGPNTLLETSPFFTELIQKLGLENERVYSAPEAKNRYIAKNRKLVPVPASPPQFLKSELFSTGAKLRLFAEPFISRGRADVEESVSQFVLRRLGPEFLDYAINPMIAGIYAGDPSKLSIRHGFPKLDSLERDHRSLLIGQFARAKELRAKGEVSKQDAPKLSFKNGLQALTDALQTRLGDRVRLGVQVSDFKKQDGTWRLNIQDANGVGVQEHDAVLFTLPAYKLAGLKIEGGDAASLQNLAKIVYAPVTTLALGFRREDVAHPLDGFGVLVPEKEKLSILGCIFSSSLFPNRAPAGHVLVTCYIGGMRQPGLVALTEKEQVELTVNDLRQLIGVKGTPVFTHRTVYQKGIPQYEVGYGKFKEAFEALEARSPGIFLAGNSRDGIALGDSILNGRAVAHRIQGMINKSVPKF